MQWNTENIYHDQAFINESNFSIKQPIRIWYAIKQINQSNL